jgi:hypothetical protein
MRCVCFIHADLVCSGKRPSQPIKPSQPISKINRMIVLAALSMKEGCRNTTMSRAPLALSDFQSILRHIIWVSLFCKLISTLFSFELRCLFGFLILFCIKHFIPSLFKHKKSSFSVIKMLDCMSYKGQALNEFPYMRPSFSLLSSCSLSHSLRCLLRCPFKVFNVLYHQHVLGRFIAVNVYTLPHGSSRYLRC